LVKQEIFTMKNRRLMALALFPALITTAAGACPVTLVIPESASGGRPLRVDFARSEYREKGGTWRSLANRCEGGTESARCRLDTQCGPHQFLLRVEMLTGVTTAAAIQRATLVPQPGWLMLSSGQTVRVDASALLGGADADAGARRVAR
jgi:hypothetical protein